MTFHLGRRAATLAFTLFLAVPSLVQAGSLPAPTGRVLLTIDGNIAHTNADGKAELDRAMLENIGMVEIETWTPFTEGSSVWRGVRLRDVMELVGGKGGSIRAGALDLYAIDIPMSDILQHDPFIALERDGRKLRVRDKGPAWILYPFADNPGLSEERIVGRCVWQLATITFE
ncbi:MAG: molybdopterin-dependent oxidoreductase [Geminicoccaceae bacterium]|nr:molybdopterin-dependent oxidoreductase [Geminicoccaceae bacterium]